MIINAAVPTTIAVTLTHAMMFMALVDFFALKYRQAKVKYKRFNFYDEVSALSPSAFNLSSLICLNNSSMRNT